MTRELTTQDAPALARLLALQSPDYLAHFHPFDFDAATIASVLSAARRDRFLGIMESGELAGFFMLRGFDEGYVRPAFGVFVAEKFAGRGLARAALASAIEWSRENHIPTIMLKVSPANPHARRIYAAAGFQAIGTCEKTGHEMMELRLMSNNHE